MGVLDNIGVATNANGLGLMGDGVANARGA